MPSVALDKLNGAVDHLWHCPFDGGAVDDLNATCADQTRRENRSMVKVKLWPIPKEEQASHRGALNRLRIWRGCMQGLQQLLKGLIRNTGAQAFYQKILDALFIEIIQRCFSQWCLLIVQLPAL